MRLQVRKFMELRQQGEVYQRKKRIEDAKKKIILQRKRKWAVKIIEDARYK